MKFLPKVADGKEKQVTVPKDASCTLEGEDSVTTSDSNAADTAATAVAALNLDESTASSDDAIPAVRALLTSEQNAACSEEMVVRYLRATGRDIRHTAHRIQATLAWWEAESPSKMFCAACRQDGEAGNGHCSHYMQVVCRDKQRRPVIYSQIGLAKNKNIEDNRRHMIATFETAISLMPPSADASWCWILDMKGFSLRDCDPRLARIFFSLAGNYYPEYLGHFWVVDAPPLFTTLWNAVQALIDPKTREKIAFVSFKKKEKLENSLKEHFDDETVAWLMAEMEDNRRERGQDEAPKSYLYGDLLRVGEVVDEAAAAGKHCNLGSPAFLAELGAWDGPLPPQLTSNAARTETQ